MKTREALAKLLFTLQLEYTGDTERELTAQRIVNLVKEFNKKEESFKLTPNDVGKFVKTRDGRKALIYKYTLGSSYPIDYVIIHYASFTATERGFTNSLNNLSISDIVGYWEEHNED